MADTSDADNEKGIDGTPEGQAARWGAEFRFAREKLKKWHSRGKKALQRFLDERDDSVAGQGNEASRLNLYTANVQTMRCIMYGKTPRVDVSRRFADSADDVARVSAEIFERILNADIQKDGDTYADACGASLDDRLVPGGGVARVRYVADLEDVEPEPSDLAEFEAPPPDEAELAEDSAPDMAAPDGGEPAQEPAQRKTYECVEVDYIHWRDFLYSVGRTWSDTRWVAFKSPLNRAEAEKQFGEKVAAALPWGGAKKGRGAKSDSKGTEKRSPWAQVDIWEVWSKEDRRRYFYCEGYSKVLVPVGVKAEEDGGVEDPYGLEGFFPCPKPMFANLTSDDFVPVPDYYLAQDLYIEIDNLQERIRLLEQAVAVRGIYDESKKEVQQLLTETGNAGNLLIPVKGLSMMGEGGSLASWIQWLPLEMVVMALDKLRDVQAQKIAQVDQITGMSDIVRGEAAQQTTATEQSIKARFASVRIQTMQDEFARFCSDLQRLKAEIISKHYDEATLVEAANMAYTADAQQPQLIQQAVQLIKSNHYAYRVEVKPESVSLTDYAALKSESMEVLQAMGAYLQMAQPLAMAAPALAPMLLQLMSWSIARVRGAQEIEGLLDRAAATMQQQQQQAASQPPPPPPPDPKLQHEQFKAQAQAQHTQGELQADLIRNQSETQNAIKQEAAKAHFAIAADSAKQRNGALAALNSAISPGGTGGV